MEASIWPMITIKWNLRAAFRKQVRRKPRTNRPCTVYIEREREKKNSRLIQEYIKMHTNRQAGRQTNKQHIDDWTRHRQQLQFNLVIMAKCGDNANTVDGRRRWSSNNKEPNTKWIEFVMKTKQTFQPENENKWKRRRWKKESHRWSVDRPDSKELKLGG